MTSYKVIPIILCTGAFLLASVCFGFLLNDPRNVLKFEWLKEYQTLVAGGLAIVAALIGAWAIFKSQAVAKMEQNLAFLQEIAHLAFVINRESYAIKNSMMGVISIESESVKNLQKLRNLLNVHKIYNLDKDAGEIAQELYIALLNPNHHYGQNVADLSKIINLSDELHRTLFKL